MFLKRLAITLCLIAAAAVSGCGRSHRATEPSAIGGPFHLTDQDGHARTEALLRGKWTAVYFGYTFCPDVCPATLQALGEAQKKLGGKADRLQFVFVTVDPERDTPKALKSYLDAAVFPKGTIGLTGTSRQVAEAAKAYRVYYAKSGKGADYQVDHLSIVYLMDPDGVFARPLAYGLTPDQMAAQIADAMKG